MPGVVFGFGEKIRMAEKIMDFGADLIDIMPAVSETEFRATKELTRMFGNRVSATSRAKKPDIDAAINAGAERITLFSPLSDLHIAQKLKITRDENIRNSCEMIDYARSHGIAVDFAGEDATRADMAYLKQFLKEIHGKIAMFFIADTVGCLTPESARKLVWYVRNSARCEVAIHFHNDFGMATANTVEGILAGADCFSGTFTGIGERAGNAPIEEVCTALHYLCGMEVNVKFNMLKEICGTVQELSGIRLQKHKPLVGENAFAHESGIHVDGILKNPKTYEFLNPEDVGQKRKICIGKHSGRKGIEHVLREKCGDEIAPEDAEIVLKAIKEAYERKRDSLSDEEIETIVSEIKCRRVLA
ncbi:homoaconitate hydratase [archaeon]|nr:homoaconitate hydratase [Nanoarchaeota archaeon]MBU4299735.1 homoaconitate hydratase [Nanoarchaeota archaeon]MBU4452549.1 homoaconitate hydratase [Nanoarchaeota archaeon]MCG2723514.1 homoaconitate hydratase [archaeon]